MRKHTIMLLAATAAMLTLALVTATANANRSLEARGGERGVTASGHLTFFGEEREAARSFWCDVTLLRTISRVIPKVIGTLMGRVTGVAINLSSCAGGGLVTRINDIRALFQASERLETNANCTRGPVILCDVATGAGPRLWKLIYEGFEGTLPEITGIRVGIEETQFKLDFDGFLVGNNRCLYKGKNTSIVAIERRVARRASSGRARTPLFSNLTGGCKANGVLDGVFTLSPNLTIALL